MKTLILLSLPVLFMSFMLWFHEFYENRMQHSSRRRKFKKKTLRIADYMREKGNLLMFLTSVNWIVYTQLYWSLTGN